MSSPFPEYFALFGIAPRFAIEPQDLSRAYREVLAQVHPDRHAAAGASQQRAAMQMASHANEAYAVLRSDSARAAYLCRLHGIALDGPGAVPLAPAFLQRQMDWHERLDEARAAQDAAAVAALAAEVAAQRAQVLAQIEIHLDRSHDYAAAGAGVRALMFLEKLAADIEQVVSGDADALAAQPKP